MLEREVLLSMRCECGRMQFANWIVREDYLQKEQEGNPLGEGTRRGNVEGNIVLLRHSQW